jgi:DNA-binding protein Fis
MYNNLNTMTQEEAFAVIITEYNAQTGMKKKVNAKCNTDAIINAIRCYYSQITYQDVYDAMQTETSKTLIDLGLNIKDYFERLVCSYETDKEFEEYQKEDAQRKELFDALKPYFENLEGWNIELKEARRIDWDTATQVYIGFVSDNMTHDYFYCSTWEDMYNTFIDSEGQFNYSMLPNYSLGEARELIGDILFKAIRENISFDNEMKTLVEELKPYITAVPGWDVFFDEEKRCITFNKKDETYSFSTTARTPKELDYAVFRGDMSVCSVFYKDIEAAIASYLAKYGLAERYWFSKKVDNVASGLSKYMDMTHEWDLYSYQQGCNTKVLTFNAYIYSHGRKKDYDICSYTLPILFGEDIRAKIEELLQTVNNSLKEMKEKGYVGHFPEATLSTALSLYLNEK